MKGKRLELSMPKSVHILFMTGSRNAISLVSKSEDKVIIQTVTIAGPAWVCISIRVQILARCILHDALILQA